MSGCLVCGEESDLQYRCNYCDERFCKAHRLPENHDCTGLIFEKSDQQWFDENKEGIGTEVSDSTDSEPYETVEPARMGSRVEPEYEHESPGLNPDGSLKTLDDSDDGNEDEIKEDTSSTFGLSEAGVLLLILAGVGVVIYFGTNI